MALNETHNAALTSWVASANSADCDFTIQNLPFGAFRRKGAPAADAARVGVAIGDQILDMQAAFDSGVSVHDRWIRQRYEIDAGPWVLRLGATDQ